MTKENLLKKDESGKKLFGNSTDIDSPLNITFPVPGVPGLSDGAVRDYTDTQNAQAGEEKARVVTFATLEELKKDIKLAITPKICFNEDMEVMSKDAHRERLSILNRILGVVEELTGEE